MLKLETEKKVKQLTKGLVKNGGRNVNGRITSFHRGGGHKQLYRLVDFKRNLLGVPGKVKRIEYDPIRTSKIALVAYSNGFISYIIATSNLKVGDVIISMDPKLNWNTLEFNVQEKGSTFFLKNCKVGDEVCNIELRPGSGGKVMRAAGTYGIIKKKDELSNYVIIKMRSNEERMFSGDCSAVLGRISNEEHRFKKLSKAGENRWRGKRPVVRGVAMNPVDHPHGGRTPGGRVCVTPWGKLTKGKKTRSPRKVNKFIIKKSK